MTQDDQEKKKNWKLLEEKMEKLNMSFHEKESIKQDILHKESEKLRKKYKIKNKKNSYHFKIKIGDKSLVLVIINQLLLLVEELLAKFAFAKIK